MKKFSSLFFLLWLFLLCSSTFAQQTVWTNNLSDKIQELSGNDVIDLVDEDATTPWGITVDTVRQKIYWTNVTEGTIKSSDLSGGNIETITSGLNSPRGLTIDVVSNTLYWAEAGHGNQSLKRMTIEDGIVSAIVSSDIVSPYHIALDRENELLYWVDNALGQKKISRVNVDGSDRETIISTVNLVSGITLDTANGYIFWADFEDDVIYRAETSGTDQGIEVFYDIDAESTPWALFFDSENEKLFWTDYLNSSISRLDTNTKEAEIWVSSVTTPSGFVAFTFEVEVEIVGAPGWRMMGTPVSGVTVADLAGQNLVQGIPDLPYDGFQPNLYMWNPTAETGDPETPFGSYVIPENGASEMTPGSGFIWFMWGPEANPEVPESKPFPVTIKANGSHLPGDVSLGTLPEGWNLMANPFAETIAFDQLTNGTDLLNVPGHVWNPNEGDVGSHILTTSLALDNKLAVWQGAFIELNEATEVVIPQTAKTTGVTFLNSEPAGNPALSGQIEFMLEGFGDENEVHTRDLSAILYFHENASTEWDNWDVSKLSSLSGTWATAAFVGERNGEPVLKAQHSVPYELEGTHQIPMDIQLQNVSGSFRLSWPVVSDLPANAEFILMDTHTGQQYDLSIEGHLHFIMEDPNKGETLILPTFNQPEIKTMAWKNSTARFMVIVGSLSTSMETEPELPSEVALDQNYPNPFNPTTIITYQLPESQHVRLNVYDITGRQVATLVNEPRTPGSHSVTFDARNLSSGVYVYRLQVGGKVISRKLTLIK